MGKTLSPDDIYQRARAFLVGRASAYARIFNPAQADARVVLRDLEQFCRGRASTFHKDPLAMAYMQGRRDVLLRIEAHLNLSTEALWLLLDGSPPPQPQRMTNDE